MNTRPNPIDHVAIAVHSIRDSLPIYERMTGATGSPVERVEAQGVDVVFVDSGTARIELLEPLRPDSPVGRFLEKRGPGLHHVAYRVEDIRAELARLEAEGMRLIDREPRAGAHGHLVAFVHPASTSGVLIELLQ